MACTPSGDAVGGIIFPLVAQQLLPEVGFGWTIRTMGFVILLNTVVIVSIARVCHAPRKTDPLVDWSAFREPSYTPLCIAMFFNPWAVYFVYFYISTFAKHAIRVSTSEYLTLQSASPGGWPAGLTADRLLGPINTLIPVAFAAGLFFYCWAAVASTGALYAFYAVYGFFFGSGIQSLFPASCANLAADLKQMGTCTGICLSFISVACLTGLPIAGALRQHRRGDFLYAQVFWQLGFLGRHLDACGGEDGGELTEFGNTYADTI